MSKNIKDSPFSLIKKISDNTYLTWVKELNKYIVLDSKILTLIVRKKLLSNSDFLNEISKTLDVSINIAKTISNEINELELNLNQSSSITHKQSSQILLDCPNDYFYSFNNVTIKVSFDSEQRVKILYGINGAGKTTFLRILEAVFSRSIIFSDSIQRIEFDQINISFSNGNVVAIRKTAKQIAISFKKTNRAKQEIILRTNKLTDPLLNPIRRVLPNLGGIDISPIVLVLGLLFIQDYIRFNIYI